MTWLLKSQSGLIQKSILNKAKIAIAIRDGWPIIDKQIEDIKNLGGEVELLPFNIPESSSSKFREKPQEGLVPSEIVPTLLKENLYGLADKRK